VVAVVAIVAACGSAFAPEATVNPHRRVWQAKSISNYQFVYTPEGRCTGRFRITVKHGAILSAAPLDPGQCDQADQALPTMDGAFDEVVNAYAHEEGVAVQYVPTCGFPTSLRCLASNEGVSGFMISEFRPPN
jgi:hypothetical protein